MTKTTPTTDLFARRIAPGVPVWNLFTAPLARGCQPGNLGCLTHLPMEGGAWCASGNYRGREFDLRAGSREAVLLAIRCIVDAADHAAVQEADRDYDEDYIEDEDGELARIRYEERRAEEAYERMHGGIDMEGW